VKCHAFLCRLLSILQLLQLCLHLGEATRTWTPSTAMCVGPAMPKNALAATALPIVARIAK
jgi:hypothetical protein